MSLFSLNTERVIEEVSQRSCLWDVSHDLYKDRDSRAAAWAEVYCAVIPNFEELSNESRKDTERAIQQRWKTARDAYNRSKTQNSIRYQGKRYKKYMYHDNMHFLDKLYAGYVGDADFEPAANAMPVEFENSRAFEEQEQPSSSDEKHKPDKSPPRPRKRRRRSRSRDSWQETRELEKELIGVFRDGSRMANNDNMAFFSSLQPFLDKFDDGQKLVFRTEVLRSIMDIRNK